jgi:hypothetical protein
MFFFGAKFFLFIDKKISEILEKYVFSSVILTNFANFGVKFAKILTSLIWKKKHCHLG